MLRTQDARRKTQDLKRSFLSSLESRVSSLCCEFSGRGGRAPIPVIAGVVGVVVLAGLAIGPWLQLGRLRQEIAANEQTISSLRIQNSGLQQQLADVQAQRAALEGRLEGLRGELTSATQELAGLRDVQVRHDALQSEKTRLEVELTRLKRERDDTNARARQLEAATRELERVTARLRNRLALADRDYRKLSERAASLERQLIHGASASAAAWTAPVQPPRVEAVWPPVTPAEPLPPNSELGIRNSESSSIPNSELRTPNLPDAPDTIELPPIVVRKDRAGEPTTIRAKVVALNPDHGFLVINQGSEDGVRVGMTFDVRRADQTLAQAVTVLLRQRLAACDLINADASNAIHVGDLAVQRGP